MGDGRTEKPIKDEEATDKLAKQEVTLILRSIGTMERNGVTGAQSLEPSGRI